MDAAPPGKTQDVSDDVPDIVPETPAPTAVAEDLVHQIEEAEWLDGGADTLRRVADRIVPPGPARDRWRGRWLGHALHPMLTDLPIGFWTSSVLVDLVGGRRGRPAAKRLVAAGVLVAVPTAVAGVAELSEMDDTATRRVGAAHAAGNTAGTALYALSWRARRRGRHWRGVLLSLAGATVLSAAGHLGGHLTYRRAAGVREDGQVARPAPAHV